MAFDAKKLAKELADEEAGAMEPGDFDEDEGAADSSVASALKDMFAAMKSGNFDAAADAFKAAHTLCQEE